MIGAGHDTLHQRCGLAINEEDLVELGIQKESANNLKSTMLSRNASAFFLFNQSERIARST